ncbi:MAG: hypothetical protein LQ340_007801, partial [Diploschistes diacapsis]
PCLLACALGALNTVISLSIHPSSPSKWTTSSIASLVLALISSLIYAFISLLIHLKISRIRSTSPQTRSRSKGKRLSGAETIKLLPEEELQRQNLLRLLSPNDNSPRVSPSHSQSTFIITIPDNARAARNPLPTTPLPLAGNGLNNNNNDDDDDTGNALSHHAVPSSNYECAEFRNNNTHNSDNASQSAYLASQHPSPPSQPFHQDSVNAHQAALSAARERERSRGHSSPYNPYSRSRSQSSRDPSPLGPAVIVNTRHPYTSSLSERHPLERGQAQVDFVPGRRGGSKDKEEHERIRAAGPDGGVWRAEDHSSCSNTYTGIDGDAEEDDGRGVARGGMREEDAGPAWEIVEGGDVVLDLGEFRRAAVPAKKIPQPRQGRPEQRFV